LKSAEIIRFKTNSLLKCPLENLPTFCAGALMDLLVALLCEVLGTEVALVGLDALVDENVVLKAAFARELHATTFELAKQKLTRPFG